MMTSSNVYIFHIAGRFWGESTGQRWFPHTIEQTMEAPVIWDAIEFIMMSL